ncbi:hypothetical protein BDY24DRAFT_402777 [Mrakia frigida]|uniref:uncharacterized protein n=1 Tax=Mrakia frigida TaxID=29902 RepID=UPI003FCBFA3D
MHAFFPSRSLLLLFVSLPSIYAAVYVPYDSAHQSDFWSFTAPYLTHTGINTLAECEARADIDSALGYQYGQQLCYTYPE